MMCLDALVRSCWLGACVTVIAAATPAKAAEPLTRPVEDRALAEVRGGFDPGGGGLVLSFTVQRSVYVDGLLAATTNDASTAIVVQRGVANSVADATGIGAAIVLQNSRSGGSIQAVTTIDAVANSAQLWRGIALQTALRSAIVDSLRR